ncbi:MAG: collagen binding domain-containing protein, partial [Planctomycetota bacterium]
VRELCVRTDADGAFLLPGLPAEKVKLHVRHADYAPAIVEVEAAEGGEGPEITVRLSRGATPRGRVLRGEAMPVGGEEVNVFRGMNFFEACSTVTDEEGRYRFDGLAPGAYTVTTGPLENQSRGVSKSGVVVPESGEVTVDLDLGGGPGEAVGVVEGLVRLGGKPVEGATVTAVDRRGFENQVAVTTDAAGRFRAEGLQPGPVTLHVATGEGSATTTRTTIPDGEDEEPRRTVEIAFGTSSLNGRLLKQDGTPVSGAWIQIERVDEDPAFAWARVKAQTTSGQDGSFRAAGLAPGTYQVRVSGGGYAGFLSEPFEIREGAAVDLGTWRLAAGLTLQGRVVDDEGTPIEDATISLRDAAGRPVFLFSLVTTGSDGRYQVTGLEAGRYVVGFEAKGYAPASRTIELGPDGGAADGTLSRGGAVDVGVEDLAGRPLAGARIVLRDGAGSPVRRTLSLVNLFEGGLDRTDEQGRLHVPDLAPGTYTVFASRDGFEATGEPPHVQVRPGTATKVRLTLRAAP